MIAWYADRSVGAGPPRREALLHLEVVEQVLGLLGDRAHAPQAGAVRQEVADGHPLLPAGGELGPVGGDRLVVRELAPLGEPVHDRRGDALRGGEAERERVARPRPRVRAVGPPRAHVEHRLAPHAHHERRAAAPAGGELREGLRRGPEPGATWPRRPWGSGSCVVDTVVTLGDAGVSSGSPQYQKGSDMNGDAIRSRSRSTTPTAISTA